MARTIQFIFNGEFGWEIIHWQAYCRKRAKDFDKAYVLSINKGSYPLYADFAEWGLQRTNVTECYQKDKRVAFKDQEFIKFGNDFNPFEQFTLDNKYVLIHARNDKNNSKNYSVELWEQVVQKVNNGYDVLSIGTQDKAFWIKGTKGCRDVALDWLFELMSNAKCIIGPSSGPMHLAALCGCPAVVWGDERTRHGKPLSHRYYESWNPFKTPVEFIETGLDWNPEPEEVVKRVERFL